ncbi:MAG: serine/threonine protein kinase [Acidobacteria bacterium]|nr:serine/threonine protein kinase [Acidobacteriota bacterium]
MDSKYPTPTWSREAGAAASRRPGPVALPVPGDLLAGRFLLGRQLGAGGSGVVFAAFDERVGQRVAIKLIYPHLVDDLAARRLRREVQAARQAHPNVAAVFDLHEDRGLPFLSMELVEGPSLRERIKSQGRLGVGETVAIGRQMATALVHLHGLGLIHRDVKPGNVLLAGEGIAKLCDMGLARPEASGGTLTETAMVVGTPAYMAPEQATSADLTAAADVYALGITLFECLTGAAPFTGNTAVETLVKRQKSPPPRARAQSKSCPRWLDGLIARMCDPEPGRRPSAAEVERTLTSGRLRFRIPVKQLSSLAAAAALMVAGWLGWQALRTPRTARVEAVGHEVRGVDDRGRTTWSLRLENPARQVGHTDLDGDGLEETLVATWPEDQPGLRMGQLPLSEFLVVAKSGKVMTQVRPEELVTAWRHPFSKRLVPSFRASDLDLDGRPEVILNARHHGFYPTEILVFWPRFGVWDWVLDHAGRIDDIAVVADPARPRLRLVGVNNRLGMLPVACDLSLLVPPLRTSLDNPGSAIPSPERALVNSGVRAWRWYVPLPQDSFSSAVDSGPMLGVGPRDETAFGAAFSSLTIDAYGNPTPGPNTGQDLLQLRLSFWYDLSRLEPGSRPVDASSLDALVQKIQQDYEPLLNEAPYAGTLALRAARAWAAQGRYEKALALLRRPLTTFQWDEIQYLLANLEAVTGDPDRAAERLRALTAQARTARGSYDALRLLFTLAIQGRDGPAVDRYVAEFVGRNAEGLPREGVAAALWAEARLWWDQATEADGSVRSWVVVPEGEAIACLARWRRATLHTTDADAMRRFIEDTPDAAVEGRLALAACLLASGSPQDALREIDAIASALEATRSADFSAFQALQLARGLRLKALAASGEGLGAKAEASKLLRSLPEGLLPYKLAQEVAESPL